MTYAYYEVQHFSLWVYLIIALVFVLIAWPILRGSFSPKIGLPLVVFLIGIVVATLRMTTYIEGQSLTVSFGWVPVLKKTVLLSDIQDAQVCSYHPFTQFWGWGWRYGLDGTHALTAKGTCGVCFRLQDGRKFIVGSSKSQKLVKAMRKNYAKIKNPEID